MMTKTNPLAIKDIEEYAKKVRQYFQIKEDECFPILEVLENLNNEGKLTLDIVLDEQLEDAYARYIVDSNTIVIKESVYEECYNGEYRSNFTLAHEFFHFIQAKVLNFSFEKVEDVISYCDVEWQANEFAGQLLLPTAFIHLDNEELVNRFHVSLECVLTRKNYIKKRKNYKK